MTDPLKTTVNRPKTPFPKIYSIYSSTKRSFKSFVIVVVAGIIGFGFIYVAMVGCAWQETF